MQQPAIRWPVRALTAGLLESGRIRQAVSDLRGSRRALEEHQNGPLRLPAHVIPIQDAGLHTYLRTLDIQFFKPDQKSFISLKQ
jgi:hypothetical protein